MAFANGFNGDIVQLNYILNTLDRKSYFVSGVNTNPGVSVTTAGESAYYYERSASTVATGTLGAKLDYTSVGAKRRSIDLTKSIQIKAVIPYANFATVSADVVGDKVIQETMTAANTYNELMVDEIEKAFEADQASAGAKKMIAKSLATDYKYTRGTTDVKGTAQALFQAKKDFIVANKKKALKPTCILMGSALVADMKAANLLAFKEFTPGGSEAMIGYFDGMAVIECPDLNAKYEAIIVNDLALGMPLNVNTLVVADGTAAGYPNGTIIAGEMGYGFEVCDPELVMVVKA